MGVVRSWLTFGGSLPFICYFLSFNWAELQVSLTGVQTNVLLFCQLIVICFVSCLPDIETVPPDLLTLTSSCVKLRMTQQPPLHSTDAGTHLRLTFSLTTQSHLCLKCNTLCEVLSLIFTWDSQYLLPQLSSCMSCITITLLFSVNKSSEICLCLFPQDWTRRRYVGLWVWPLILPLAYSSQLVCFTIFSNFEASWETVLSSV